MRRMVDVWLAALLLAITLPVILVIALLIKLESHGPVFYTPTMVGWKGKLFSLFRFRTLYRGDEREHRFTRVGSFIQNYSLDHLPQLLNLLKGDITLIGPRPMEVSAVDLQDPIWQQYTHAKPGLINYAVYKLGKEWTPSRSTNPELNQELELQYLKQRSIVADAKLFLQSLRKFMASKGNIKARGETEPDLRRDEKT